MRLNGVEGPAAWTRGDAEWGRGAERAGPRGEEALREGGARMRDEDGMQKGGGESRRGKNWEQRAGMAWTEDLPHIQDLPPKPEPNAEALPSP